MTRIDERVEATLHRSSVGVFTEHELDGLPDRVSRYLDTAIAPGTPLTQSAHIEMKGHIRVGRWLPFRAYEVLTPQVGFVWAARAAGVINGSDRFVNGRGEMQWKLGGLLTLMTAHGSDVSRSAAERAGAEAVWVPTSLLPRFGVDWKVGQGRHIIAAFNVGEYPIEVDCSLNSENLIESVVFQRWGDPDNRGDFGLHVFGGHFHSYDTFDGVTIPTAGNLGWHYGTDRWSEGEFFRFRITKLKLGE